MLDKYFCLKTCREPDLTVSDTEEDMNVNVQLYLGKWVCSCWPFGDSSVVLGNHECELPVGQDAQMDGS